MCTECTAPNRKVRGFFMPDAALSQLRILPGSRTICRRLFDDEKGFAAFFMERGPDTFADIARVLREALAQGKRAGDFRSWEQIGHAIDGTLRCCRCKSVKPIADFATVRKRAITKCRRCDAERVRKARTANVERARALARRKYWADVDRSRREARERAKTERSRKINCAAVRRYRKKHPARVRAQQLLRLAIKRGDIVRPSACQIAGCNRSDRLHAHHADYDRPLQVIFVCAEHHEHIHHVGPLLLKAPVGRRKHAVAPPETFRPHLPTAA